MQTAGRNRQTVCCALWMVVGLLVTHAGRVAADQVWIAPTRATKADSNWYPKSVRTDVGTVQQFDAKQMRLLVQGDEKPTVIAAHRVLWIEAKEVSDQEAKAIESFKSGKYAESIRPLIGLLQQRPPVWKQQWLSMLAAQAAFRGGQGKVALELVSQLDSRPLPPLVLASLPVAWEGPPRDARGRQLIDEQAATERLTDPSAAVRLVAASWLMSTTSRGQATRVLEQLSVDAKRPIVARLAEIASWRTVAPSSVQEQSKAWIRKVDDLPMVLQTGPTRMLADLFQRSGLSAEAKRLKLSLELTPLAPSLP